MLIPMMKSTFWQAPLGHSQMAHRLTLTMRTGSYCAKKYTSTQLIISFILCFLLIKKPGKIPGFFVLPRFVTAIYSLTKRTLSNDTSMTPEGSITYTLMTPARLADPPQQGFELPLSTRSATSIL